MIANSGMGKKGTQDPAEYLSKGWFPVNTPLLRAIQNKLKSGIYDSDRSLLINDIKADLSLFTHCLRTLGTIVDPSRHNQDPMEILHSIEIENLRKILEEADDHIGQHTFDPHMKPQLGRIKQMLVAGSTAEILGEKEGISSDIVLPCSVARQLGMTLVAYNYPRIYSQALSSLKPENDDLERSLKKILGFSPTQLGVRLALGWNTNPEIKVGTGQVELVDDEDDPLMAYRRRDGAHKRGEALKKICTVSETLAQLSDSEHFPASAKKWNGALAEVKRYLGPDGLKIIEDRLHSKQGNYASLGKDLFKATISPEQSVRATNSNYAHKLQDENAFLKKCHGNIRAEFQRVYEKIVMGQVSTDGLSILVSEVIPLTGFVKGCVYLADNNHNHLVPMLRIGSTQLSDFKSLIIEDSGTNLHPAIDALRSSTPVRQENVFVNGELVSHISSSFGNSQRSGVLFLQMGKALLEGEREISLMYFRAVKQCLADCLNLRS